MFIDRKTENFSKLCLIGMSGVGKSYWAQKFELEGYQLVSCDQRICEHILHKIGSADEIISSLGTWLGFPWQDGFQQREKIYRDLENEYMFELSGRMDPQPTILDSTGSLIYCSPETLKLVKDNFLVIYLKLTSEQQEKIIRSYSTEPRPILWNNRFPKELSSPQPTEIENQLRILIEEREMLYQNLADLTILSKELENCLSAKELLRIIKQKYGQK